jgi:uncharacterized protein (DUF1501 family)
MLTFSSQQSGRMCDGIRRREFLRLGGLALGGLTLADLLAARTAAAESSPRPRQKSVIMVFLAGGPSHIDMYDLKPDAPLEIRGEFNPIDTNVSGLRVCEHLPLHAKIADKFSIVNGVKMIDTHSAWVVMTGFDEKMKRPVVGSVVSKLLGSSRGGMPTYVALGGENGADPGEPFFLGHEHRPFKPNQEGLESLGRLREIPLERFEDRRQLLSGLDALARRAEATAENLAGHAAFTAQAFEMLTSPKAREAFDLQREPKAVREKFGVASRLLLARRLVEAGVPIVTLSLAGTICPPGDWDTHAGDDQRRETNFSALRKKLPVYDHAIHALITDLYERGLNEDVLLVVCGEFGRTPKINKMGGRDHWAPAGSVLLSGGGLRMGCVVGNTGPKAEQSIDVDYSGQNILATIYQHLGISPATKVNDFSGRPRYLLDDQRPIKELA